MAKKLKECPFCGEKARISFWEGGSYVECFNTACDVQPSTKDFYTEDEAIEAWNRRGKNA